MADNLHHKGISRWVPIAAVGLTTLGGAAGYVDTDLSGYPDVVAAPANAVFQVNWIVAGFASQLAGARQPSGVDAKYTAAVGTHLCKISSADHIEYYRGAADVGYVIVGYWT